MLSRNLFTSRGDDLSTCSVPNRNRINGAGVARAQQPLALDIVRIYKHGGAAVIEHECLGCFADAVAETHAQRAVDADPEISNLTLLEVAHIPSSPKSARAVSITAGVISLIPRSFA